jgi:aldehyde dehydrogenase (NAD+)/succinate-semialdehyde dehydrogenase/glutarate-semialdehyde dehydrogenase
MTQAITGARTGLPASVTEELLARLTARVPSSTGETWKLTEVYSGEVVTALPQSTPQDVAAAYARARAAQRDWARWPLRKRLKVFRRLHQLLIDRNDTIVDLVQVESGKARRMAFEETVDPMMVITHYLKRAPKLLRPVRRAGPVPLVSSSTEIRQPKGVVGIIAPWNFPFATGLSDAIPALIAGNGVVLNRRYWVRPAPTYRYGY